MDVFEALQRRRTVRAFLDLPVPRETLETILGAALRTPSWANTQPWEIYVAGGEVLERVRATFVERTRAKVPGHRRYGDAGRLARGVSRPHQGAHRGPSARGRHDPG